MLGLELGTGVSGRQSFEGHQLAGGGGSRGEEVVALGLPVEEEELWGHSDTEGQLDEEEQRQKLREQ